MNETRIVRLPTESEITEMVVELITPERADREARILIEMITSVANFENPEQANLAQAIIDTAYSRTYHCQRAIEKGREQFTGAHFNSAQPVKDESDQPGLIG